MSLHVFIGFGKHAQMRVRKPPGEKVKGKERFYPLTERLIPYDNTYNHYVLLEHPDLARMIRVALCCTGPIPPGRGVEKTIKHEK